MLCASLFWLTVDVFKKLSSCTALQVVTMLFWSRSLAIHTQKPSRNHLLRFEVLLIVVWCNAMSPVEERFNEVWMSAITLIYPQLRGLCGEKRMRNDDGKAKGWWDQPPMVLPMKEDRLGTPWRACSDDDADHTCGRVHGMKEKYA